MLTGPKFARASYTLFSIAILMALLKLGGITGVKPFVLRTAPATPVARAAEPVPGENLRGASLNLPERRYTLGGRLLPELTGRQEGENSRATSDAPVFYRPAPARGADEGDSKAADAGEPVCGDLGDFPRSSRVVFPLPKTYFNSYEDTWGAARPQGGHEGTDLMSPAETPEFAITDGEIVPVSGANENGWNRLGGYTVMLEAAYDVGPIKKGDLFYYAHLNEESTLPVGTKVRAGQRIGLAGDTGEGQEGARGKFPPHLHLGWYDTDSTSDRTDLESGAMNPYPLLLWLEENGGSVAGGMDAAYCEAPQEPVPEPPADEESRTTGSGTSSDLDTGDAGDARPSPVVEESHHHSSDRRREPDAEEGPDDPGERLDPSGKNPDAGPADESERPGDSHDESPAPAADGPAKGESQASSPPDKGRSPKTEIREKGQTLLAEPRSDRASRPSYAPVFAALLRAQTSEDRDERDGAGQDTGDQDAATTPSEKEERKPPDPSEEEPEASGSDQPEDRPRPTPREPEKNDKSSAACDPPRKLDQRHDVRIALDHADGRRTPIKHDVWLALVEDDPEMWACEKTAEAPTGAGKKPRYEGLAVWTGHPDHDEIRFYLRGGKVVTENPDEPTIEKMQKIADALNAKVEDDDGEKH